eukprot:COSAG02_NODE_20014_length_852_cov_1.103586_1_plen_201_part_10
MVGFCACQLDGATCCADPVPTAADAVLAAICCDQSTVSWHVGSDIRVTTRLKTRLNARLWRMFVPASGNNFASDSRWCAARTGRRLARCTTSITLLAAVCSAESDPDARSTTCTAPGTVPLTLLAERREREAFKVLRSVIGSGIPAGPVLKFWGVLQQLQKSTGVPSSEESATQLAAEKQWEDLVQGIKQLEARRKTLEAA